jgi:hypothetical protein
MMQLVVAFEVHGVLENEMNIAQHQYQQMILHAWTSEMHFLNAQSKLQKAKEELDFIVDIAVRDVSTAINDSGRNSCGPHEATFTSPPGECTASSW